MLHIVLHLAVPLAIAYAFFRPRELRAALILIGTMVVDVDHLVADPIYDPQRCSIGFHPLHSAPAIVIYALTLAAAIALAPRLRAAGHGTAAHVVQIVGLGLLLHMALDWGDCML